eukprot:TRINITY_DN1717_c0_g1_i1.p1 TRINITY_DN1717_c0_g1~~TRINITY_DN1717_c0_g1_i1.p1  ORF type:complete len:376 (+),score=90.65 TRINITY_DN1717_c0_g1_i1:187-1314(+)
MTSTAHITGPVCSSAVGYRIEGSGDEDSIYEAGDDIIDDPFDLSDTDYIYFNKTFFDNGDAKDHLTLLAGETPIGPIGVSALREGDEYIAVIRTKDGTRRVTIPASKVKVGFFRKLFGKGPAGSDICKALDPALPGSRVKVVKNPKVREALLRMEEKQNIKGFKFGLLYSAEGQTKEDEMFANVESSDELNEFIDFIGERVDMQGWERFRAGLDITNGSTGPTSLFHEYNNSEVMFHVSTLLPWNEMDKQQLERKRHIGNDIVVIVFQDGDTVYRPTTISARMVHVVFLVKKVLNPEDPDNTYYRLAIISKDAVPEFGPVLPDVAVYKKGDEFKEMFYRKLLNAEKACYKAKMLDDKLTRARNALLKDMAETYPA